MPIRLRQFDPRTRGRMVFANLCLAVGLLLSVFVHPAGQIEQNWLHAACGFLLGVSIAVNLFGLLSVGRCSASEAGKL